jgi:hypothetical protein
MKVRAADRERPWMGLHSFPEDSADYFHGRRVEADEMYSLCVRETLALLYGKSGLGKTSLIQAAIAPRLRDNDYLPVVARLNYDGRAPSLIEQVVQHLRNSVQISKADLVFPPEFGTLWELFHHKQFEIWSRTSRSLQTPVLILDQFEEYIISGVDTAIGADLLANLRQLINNRPPESLASQENFSGKYIRESFCCKVLLVIREDFLANLEPLRREFPALKYNHYRLVPMTGSQARDAVICPAPDLVDGNTANAILAALSVQGWRPGMPIPPCEVLEKAEVSPALLSLLCDELNEKRIAHGQSCITADLVNENRDKILSTFFDRCLEGKPASLRKFIEDQLVTGSGYRDHEEIGEALQKSGATESDFNDLVNRRLLKYEEQGPVTWVELSHDMLVDVASTSRRARRERERTEAEERRRFEEKRLLQEKLEHEEARRIEQERLHAKRSFQLKLAIGGAAVIFCLFACAVWQAWELNEAKEQLRRRIEELSAAQDAISFASTIADSVEETACLALDDYARDVPVVPESTKTLLLGFLDALEKVWKQRDPTLAAKTRANLAYSRMVMLFGAGDVEGALRIAMEVDPILSQLDFFDNRYKAKFYRLKGDLLFRKGILEDERKNQEEALLAWSKAIEAYEIAAKIVSGDDLFASECWNRIGGTKRFIAGKQSDPLLASNLLASAEEYFQDTIRIAQRVTYRDDPKWTLVLAEAYNRIGLIHKTRGEQSKDPERASQLAMARGGFALAREIYKRLLAREPNNKIALARLVLTTANQVLVAERLGDRKVLGDDIVPLLEDRIKYSRRLFEMDRSNPYFAALLSTGLMIRAEQIVALTGDNDNEVLNTQKPLCRGAWRLAEEALEITQRNLRKDLFSTFRRICLKLGYREELARIDQIEGTPKSTEPLFLPQ